MSGGSAFRSCEVQCESSNWTILKSSIRAIVRSFFAIMSIISNCVLPQGFAENATLQGGNASLSQHRGALAILYHDDHALIAQSKASRPLWNGLQTQGQAVISPLAVRSLNKV